MLVDTINDLISNKVYSADYVGKLIGDVSEVLKEEYRACNGLIRMFKPLNKFLVVGDLHGDLQSLMYILKFADRSGIHSVVFLGDYVDRGERQVETFLIPLYLKLRYPENVFLLRGNHEPPDSLPVYPHDFPIELRRRYGSINGVKLYLSFKEVFQLIPHAMIVENNVLLLHGGPPTNNVYSSTNADDYLVGRGMDEHLKILEEVLWNDPIEEVPYAEPSYRGAGYLFGYRVTEAALNITKTKAIIRGHEPCFNGFKTNHKGRVITIFSRLGPPYDNAYASFMILTSKLRLDELTSEKVVMRFTSHDI